MQRTGFGVIRLLAVVFSAGAIFAAPPAESKRAPASPPAADSEGHHQSFADVERWEKIFEDPTRLEWQRPVAILDFLAIELGSTVADIGAGTGYFTVYLSTAVGSQGRVFAVDIEPAMIEYIRKRQHLQAKQVIPLLGAPDDPRLPDDEIDVAVIINTWHHIEGRPAYINRLEKVLSPAGRVAVIDWRDGELPVGPPPSERLARERVVAEFSAAGWTLGAESYALPYQYMLVFHPPAAERSS